MRDLARGNDPFEGVRVGVTPMHGPRPRTWRLHLFPPRVLLSPTRSRARTDGPSPVRKCNSASMHLCGSYGWGMGADQPYPGGLGEITSTSRRKRNICAKLPLYPLRLRYPPQIAPVTPPETPDKPPQTRAACRHVTNAPPPAASQIAR